MPTTCEHVQNVHVLPAAVLVRILEQFIVSCAKCMYKKAYRETTASDGTHQVDGYLYEQQQRVVQQA